MAEKPIDVVRCVKCNKPLSDPDSIKRGMGAVCYAATHKNQEEVEQK